MFVSDGGNFWLIGFVLFNIIVLDINDNNFVFVNKFYLVNIIENLVIGILILKVFVIDNDIGMNGEVLYFIECGLYLDFNFVFSIYEKIGVVVNNILLDYEKKYDYSILVWVRNFGVLGLFKFDVVIVVIYVLDINDNKFDIWVEF